MMSASERQSGYANGVKDAREIGFVYDGIVFATGIDQVDFALEPVHLYPAIPA